MNDIHLHLWRLRRQLLAIGGIVVLGYIYTARFRLRGWSRSSAYLYLVAFLLPTVWLTSTAISSFQLPGIKVGSR